MNIKYLAAIMTITALTAPAYAAGANNTIGGTDNIATANSAAVFGYQNQTHANNTLTFGENNITNGTNRSQAATIPKLGDGIHSHSAATPRH